MSINDTSAAEATISDEELELELELDGTESEDELRQKASNAEKAKKQILARARKAEAELKALKEAANPTVEAPKQATDEDALWEIADYIRQGYTQEDARFIKNNGGRAALNDPNSYVSVALRQLSEQRKAEQAATIPDTTGMTEVERKYTPEQLSKMSVADLEKLLPKAD